METSVQHSVGGFGFNVFHPIGYVKHVKAVGGHRERGSRERTIGRLFHGDGGCRVICSETKLHRCLLMVDFQIWRSKPKYRVDLRKAAKDTV